MRRMLPKVFWMTDARRTPDPARLVMRLPRGTGVILRHYDEPGRSALAETLAALCRAKGLVLFVSNDWRLAARVGARGLHLPEHAAARGPSPGARLWLKRRLLTAAAHGPNGLARAKALRADAALLSPLFATASHPGVRTLGLVRAALMLHKFRLPVIALGGLAKHQAPALFRAGFAGFAGIDFALKAQQKI